MTSDNKQLLGATLIALGFCFVVTAAVLAPHFMAGYNSCKPLTASDLMVTSEAGKREFVRRLMDRAERCGR